METRRRVGSGVAAIALLVVSITITAAILVAMSVDTLAPASLSASTPLQCTKTIYPEVPSFRLVEDCRAGSKLR